MNRVGGIIAVVAFLSRSVLGFAAEPKPSWELDWDATLAAAKKEGRVNVYISGYEAILPDFSVDHPEIQVIAVAGRGSEIGQRIAAERRGEKYIADVVSAGANPNYQQFYRSKFLEPIKPALMLPDVLDQSKWYQGRHTYADPEERYVFVYVGSATYGAVNYNTKLVRAGDFKSYWDLLDPKWKGKIEARDVRKPGPGSGNMRFFYHHPEIGAPFIKRLFGEMGITLFQDPRQGSDWLATGKFSICFFCDVDTMKKQGLPVDTFGPKVFKEGGGLVQQFGTVALMKNAPHPNAARVFINWLLSPKGQLALQKRTAQAESPADSLRIDIPKDDVPYESRRLPGVTYLDTGRPDWIDMTQIYKVINGALESARK